WDANLGVAVPMRSKEEAHDYRYFPEPDLQPVFVGEEWVQRVREQLPEHPTFRRDRFVSIYGLSKYDADVLTSEKGYSDYFEHTVGELSTDVKEQVKQAANWVMGDVLRVVSEQ